MTVIHSHNQQNCVGTNTYNFVSAGVESFVSKAKATPHAIKHGTFSPNFTCLLFRPSLHLQGELANRNILF